MTMKKLVERAPMAPIGSGRVYNGEKRTVTYAIDGRTGRIVKDFGPEGGARFNRCKSRKADELEDMCQTIETDTEILVTQTSMNMPYNLRGAQCLQVVFEKSLHCHYSRCGKQ